MNPSHSIEPIVVPQRDNASQKGNVYRLTSQPLVVKDEECLMTAVSRLDTSKPIDEDTIDRYAALVRRIRKQMTKSEYPPHDADNKFQLDYDDFKTALGLVKVIVLESRAMSLFRATVLDDSKRMSHTDLEIALMINDSYPVHSSFLPFYELFSSFDLDECGRLNFEQFKECVNTISFEEGRDHKDLAYLAYIFRKTVPEGRINYDTFTQLWCSKLADVKHVLGRRGLIHNKIQQRQNKQSAKQPRDKMRRISGFFSSVWRHFKLKEILQQEMTKPGHDIITQFETVRQKIVDLRIQVQRAKDKEKRSSKILSRKQKRKGLISASQRKKEMSLILRSEVEKTQLMLEENRSMREKLLKHCEDEKVNIEFINRRKRHEQMVKEEEEIQQTSADRMILCDMGLSEIPISIYSDQSSQLKLADVKIFDLSGNDLVALPKVNFLFHLISLRKLCLSRNKLNDIPDEISAMKSIEIITIDGNNLTKLPSQIKELHSLQILDLSTNKLETVQDEISTLCNLKVLKLHSNQIRTMPESIGNLKCLQSIDLSSNRISYLPDSFCSLDHLVKVNLSNNHLTDLPMQFGSLQNIEDLDISFNNIQILPDSMSKLKHLKLFNIDQNKVMEIGDFIGGFKSLLSLEGTNNNCSRLSTKIGSLSSLNRLSLPMNRLETLPAELGLIGHLVHLNLYHNCIHQLPVEVGALNRLQTLDMSHNILSTLPHELCFMKSLSWIDLSHNNIDCLPEHFGSLRNLRVLKLSNNKLKGVPKTFYQLENVHELDLSSNYLREVEIGLCEGLVSLKEANFESNRIKHLPQQICTMPLLERLNLRHNDLNSLPLDLANSQIQVDIAQNPLHDLPFKFHSRPNDSINNMNTAYQNPSGYTKEDVNDWMKKEDLLYKPAVDEWNMKKTLYMSGDLSYDNYMSGVIWRCENVYRDMDTMAFKEDRMVIKRVKQFYFHCKKYGNPPLYIQRSYEENKRREDDAAHLLECREERFKVARDIDMKRRAEEYETYFGNLSHRCSSADDRFKKYKDEKATLEKAETQKLLDNVTHKMIEKDKLDIEKEKIEKISLKKETERLNALSFQSHRNKKRFLPIEIDACWKSDQDTIININHQRIT